MGAASRWRSSFPGSSASTDSEIGARRTTVSRPGLGHLCACAGWSCSGAGAGPSMPRPATMLTTRRSPRRRSRASAARALPYQSFSLARHSRDARLLPDRRSQHAHRRSRQRSEHRRAVQAGRPPAIEAAKQTALGKVYLDWGTWAVVRDVGQEPDPRLGPAATCRTGRTWTTVEFTDLRFAYAFMGGDSRRPPSGLTGMGLHHRWPRRRRRVHRRPRTEVARPGNNATKNSFRYL